MMRLAVQRCRARQLPGRLAAGAWIVRAGKMKLRGDAELANTVHSMASSTYPFLRSSDPQRFMRGLATVELAVGTTLLLPVVPAAAAGTALSAFSLGLLGMYATRPELREPGSIWPNDKGRTLAKDVWLLAIGVGLVVDGLTSPR